MSEKQQENKTVKKPFILRHDDAENRIFNAVVNAVNVDKIPFSLIEGILTNILHQVRENAKAEKAQAKQSYASQIAENEENVRGD